MCLFYESAILFLGIYPKTAVTHRLKTIYAKMFRENSKNKTVKQHECCTVCYTHIIFFTL